MKLLIINFIFLINYQNYYSQNISTIGNNDKSHRYVKHQKSNVLLILDTFNIAISIDTSIWKITKEKNELPCYYNLLLKGNNNRFDVKLAVNYLPDTLIDQPIDSIIIPFRGISDDAKIVKKKHKKLNNNSLWMIDIMGTIKNKYFIVVGCYYRCKIGNVHLVAFSSPHEMNIHRKQIKKLFNGIIKYPS